MYFCFFMNDLTFEGICKKAKEYVKKAKGVFCLAQGA